MWIRGGVRRLSTKCGYFVGFFLTLPLAQVGVVHWPPLTIVVLHLLKPQEQGQARQSRSWSPCLETASINGPTWTEVAEGTILGNA